MKRIVVLAGGALALVLVAGVSHQAAAQNAVAVVKERKDLMGAMWPSHYKEFSAVAKGESTDMAGVPAKALAASAAVRKLPALFPAGTGREAAPETRAKPEIWSQRAEFEAAVAKLAGETEKLGEVAKGGNLDAYKVQFTAVFQACGGCHDGPAKSGGKFRFEAP